MRFNLTKDTIIKDNDNKKVIYNNKSKNNIVLSGFAIKLFEKLINLGDEVAIHSIIEQSNVNELSARATLNSLLYPLLNLKLIAPVTKFNNNGQNINITTAAIETTNVCNFRCPHCYVDKADSKNLSCQDIKNIIDELYELNTCNLLFTGGEVLTHKFFKDFYLYAYKKGFIITINTNGSLIDDSLMEFIKRTPPYSIEISLYGHNQETFENFTKTKVSFESIVSTLEKLKKASVNVMCKSVITNTNKSHYKDIEKICKNLNIPFKKDYIAFPQLDKSYAFNPEQIEPEEAIELLKEDSNCQKQYLKIFDESIENKEFVFQCRKNNDGLFFSSDGNINICPCMQSVSYKYEKGNLFNSVISLQKLGDIKFNENSKCKNCKYISLCRYCPAKFYLTTGDYQTPPKWFCDFGELMYSTFIEGLRFVVDYLSFEEIEKVYNRGVFDLKFDEWIKEKIKGLEEEKFVKAYVDGKLLGFANFNEKYSFVGTNDLLELLEKDNVKVNELITSEFLNV